MPSGRGIVAVVQDAPVLAGIITPGRSAIVGPMGGILDGPLEGRAGMLTAEIDLDEIRRGRFDFDVTGHYMRPDVFRLAVNTAPQPAVTRAARPEGHAKDEPT